MTDMLGGGFAGTGGGAGLGNAHGTIVLDTSQLAQAANTARLLGRQIDQSLSQIDTPVRRAQGSLNALAGTVRDLAGAFGVTLGLAGAVQLGRAAVAAAETATAYRRQEVAARNLAGSQENLNELLRAYQEATGGAIDQATALGDVTQLISVGFADSTEELNQFARVIRGISIAMGTSQDTVTQNLILELFSQRGQRLDQLGLQYENVRQRSDELRAADASLTEQMAYQQAVLEEAEKRFGALADSIEGQASGVEIARRTWADLRLELGKIAGPGINLGALILGAKLQAEIDRWRAWEAAIRGVARALRLIPGEVSPTLGSRTGIGANVRQTPQAFETFNAEQRAAIAEWGRERAAIERRVGEEINDAAAEYGRQRADTIRNYQQTLLRESEDFARQRQRQEEELARNIADLREEAARRQARAERDLARRISDLQDNSAERRAEWEADRAERVADVQAETNDRLLELEEDYQKARLRAGRDHRDNLLSAAARLDAIALQAERRRFAREQQDAQEAHADQISETREAEQKRLREIQDAHEERLRDEQKALERQIRQAQEAHARQLADAAEADQRRIEDMQEAFARQQRVEDEDRRVRLQRMAEDHQAQLAEQATAHQLRLQQINEHAAEEREELEDAFMERLDELGIHNDAWLEVQEAGEKRALRSFEAWWEEINRIIGPPEAPAAPTPGFPSLNDLPEFQSGGLMPHTGLAYLHAGEMVLSPGATRTLAGMLGGMSQRGLVQAASSRNITVNMPIYGATDPERIAAVVTQLFERLS